MIAGLSLLTTLVVVGSGIGLSGNVDLQHRSDGPSDVTPAVIRSFPASEGDDVTFTTQAVAASSTSKVRAKLGRSASGAPWLSGVWTGGRFTPSAVDSFGRWRGRPVDLVTTYSRRDNYRAMVGDAWSINVWKGFPGRLNYGLALLPDSGEGSLTSIARGDQDWVWRGVARNLKAAGRGNSIVRIGWEANLPDWRWGVTASNAAAYKSAFRRVAKVLRTYAPRLVIDFGVGCGPGLRGSKNRMAPLTALYPGDDVVDLIHCDVYDWWTTRVKGRNTNPLGRPPHGVGLEDVARFARSHRKLMGVGEWGLAARHNGNGGGDNPLFINAMRGFIKKNTDVFAYECYFDEPDAYLKSSLTAGGQNPRAARTYRTLW